ncbi:hypothetical protein [Arthrobacter sp. ERGS1:01]|nr:hypothetical protein [Arthrobacter sp. ERGS1:01]
MTKDPEGHFVVDLPASTLPEIRSAIIYDFPAREAFGSPSLTASPPY